MRPTQRNLMKKSILILSLLFSATSPVVAGQDVDIVANIKNKSTALESPNIPRPHFAYATNDGSLENVKTITPAIAVKTSGRSMMIVKHTRCSKTDSLKKILDESDTFFKSPTEAFKL